MSALTNALSIAGNFARPFKEAALDVGRSVATAPGYFLKTLPYGIKSSEKDRKEALRLNRAIAKQQDAGRRIPMNVYRQMSNRAIGLTRRAGVTERSLTNPAAFAVKNRLHSALPGTFAPAPPSIRGEMAITSGTAGTRTAMAGAGLKYAAPVIRKMAPIAMGLGSGMGLLRGVNVQKDDQGGYNVNFELQKALEGGAEGLGSAISSLPRVAALNLVTQPMFNKIFNAAIKGGVDSKALKVVIGGATNLAEDQVYTILTEGRLPTGLENGMSVVLGGVGGYFYKPNGSIKMEDESELFYNEDLKRWQGKDGKIASTVATKLNKVKNVLIKKGDVIVGEFKSRGMNQGGFIKPDEFLPGKPAEGQLSFLKEQEAALKAAEPPKLEGSGPKGKLTLEEALQESQKLRAQQDVLTSQTRSQRVGAAVGAGEGLEGKAQLQAELGQLKGEIPKVDSTVLKQQMDAGEVAPLFKQINDSGLKYFETVRARTALSRMFGEGKPPTKSEIALLRKVFPDDVLKNIPQAKFDLKKLGIEGLNLPRALMATADLSAPLRQGVFLIGRPKQWMPAFKDMFKYAFSENAYAKGMEDIKAMPEYDAMVKNKLSLTELGDDLTLREESIISSLPEKFPIFGPIARGANRAYTGFLNKLRADVFSDLYTKMEVNGELTPKVGQDISKFVNAATGRGDLGALNKIAPTLNGLFFSPRLIASRVNLMNPKFYADLSAPVRKEALKSLLSFGGTALTVLGLAKLGGAEVEEDMTNADFGKIREGNTRYDILGGFQQYARLIAQLKEGKVTSSQTGNIITLGEGFKPLTRSEILTRFFRNKLSPVASFVWSLMDGKNNIGQDFELGPELVNRFVPMVIQDIYDLAKEEGWDPDDPSTYGAMGTATVKGLPAIFGTGVQTYGTQQVETGEDVFGRQSAQIKQVPGLGEDIAGLITGDKPLGTTQGFNAESYVQQLDAMSPEEAAQEFNRIKQLNPDITDKIIKIKKDQALGITAEDKRIKAMGVKNGGRAQHIFKEAEKLETQEEKAAYISELIEKKIATKEVLQQLNLLVRQQ